MTTWFVNAGPVTTIAVTAATDKYLLLSVRPNADAWLTADEARELATRLNALADGMEAPPRNAADQLSLEEASTEI